MTNSTSRSLAVAVGVVGNVLGGMLYMFPIYTDWLQAKLRIKHEDVMTLGNLSHCGLCLVMYPLAIMHSKGSNKARTDRLVAFITGFLHVCSTALVFVASLLELSRDQNMVLLSFAFLCFGAGTGGNFGHSTWVNSHNFRDNRTRKRLVLSGMSLSLGGGAALFSGLFSTCISPLIQNDVGTWFAIQAALYLCSFCLRFAFQQRLPDVLGRSGETHLLAREDRDLEEQDGLLDLERRVVDNATTPTCMEGFLNYWSDPVAVLTFLSVTIGIGQAGSFLSILGQMLDAVNASASVVGAATATFLGSQTAGRFVVMLVQLYGDVNDRILALAQVLMLASFLVLSRLSGIQVVFATAVVVGFGFGMTWAAFPVFVESKLPGGRQSFQLNLGITFYAILVGNMLYLGIETAVFSLANPSPTCQRVSNDEFVGTSCYSRVYAAFSCVALLGVTLSSINAYINRRLQRSRPSQTTGLSSMYIPPARFTRPPQTVIKALEAKRVPVAIIGGTGLVGRILACELEKHPWFSCGPIVGSKSSAGRCFFDVCKEKQQALENHYGRSFWPAEADIPATEQDFPSRLRHVKVMSIEELLQTDCTIAISCVAPRFGSVQDILLANGFTVVSISPYKRQEAILGVPEVNLYNLQASPNSTFVASPNCVVCGASVVLQALAEAFDGVTNASITTFQSLSGRGDAMYPYDWVRDNILPVRKLDEGTEALIEEELKSVLGGGAVEKLSVSAYRVSVRRGHLIDVRVSVNRPAESEEQVMQALSAFNPLLELSGDLPSLPSQPLDVCDQKAFPRPASASSHEGGRQISVGNIKVKNDDMFDIALTLVVDNLQKGALAAALQLLEAKVVFQKMASD